MNKEQLQALGLTDEQVTKILEGFKGFIPPSRFNEVNEAKKSAEQQLAERDKQLNELKKNLAASEDVTKQIEALQAENKAAKERYEQELMAFKVNNAVDLALAQSGAKNLKAVKALIDFEKIKLDGDKVSGLEEQIKALTSDKESSFLFKTEEKEHNTPVGMKPAEGSQPKGETGKPMSLFDAIAQKFNQ